MQTLRKCSIPEYLKKGQLYRNLIEISDDPNEEVTFPTNTLKHDTTVDNDKDCDILLQSMTFWGVDEFFPNELARFVLNSDNSSTLVEVLRKYQSTFSCIRWLLDTLTADPSERWKIVIQSGSLDFVQALASMGAMFPPEAPEEAARLGSVDILRFLHQQGLEISVRIGYCAAVNGHSEALKFILETTKFAYYFERDLIARIFHFTVLRGQLNCIKVLHEHGCDWDANLCEYAATKGQMICLQYLHEHDCPWNENTCTCAAGFGHLNCLQYAHEQGCLWDKDTCTWAAMSSELECLKYAHEHGCPWDVETYHEACGPLRMNIIQYAHEHGCPWDETFCEAVASEGNLEILQYAHENGCPWNEGTCVSAAMNGYLDCLQYAHEHGCPIDVETDRMNRENPCWEYVHQLTTA